MVEFNSNNQPDDIIDALNRYALTQRITGERQDDNINEAGKLVGDDRIERTFSGADQGSQIDRSARNRTAGLSEVQVDASTSVLNNFLSIGTGNQTANRLVPAPPQFGGMEQKQTKTPSYAFGGKASDSPGSVNNNKDQGGIN